MDLNTPFFTLSYINNVRKYFLSSVFNSNDTNLAGFLGNMLAFFNLANLAPKHIIRLMDVVIDIMLEDAERNASGA